MALFGDNEQHVGPISGPASTSGWRRGLNLRTRSGELRDPHDGERESTHEKPQTHRLTFPRTHVRENPHEAPRETPRKPSPEASRKERPRQQHHKRHHPLRWGCLIIFLTYALLQVVAVLVVSCANNEGDFEAALSDLAYELGGSLDEVDVSTTDLTSMDGWDGTASYTVAAKSRDDSDREAYLSKYTHDANVEVHITWPEVTGTAHDTEINQLIKDLAQTYARSYVDNPSDLVAETVDSICHATDTSVAELREDETYVITHADDHLLSVAFDDDYLMGSWYLEVRCLRCVTIDLDTGTEYALGDVLSLTPEVCNAWVSAARAAGDAEWDGLISDEEFAAAMQGATVDGVTNMNVTYFIGPDGTFYLGVNYWLSVNTAEDSDTGTGTSDDSGNTAIARGWLAEPLDEGILASARTNSHLWELLAQAS